MGRTVPTFRMVLEQEITSWAEFRRALRPDDQNNFDQIMNAARLRADAGGYISRTLVSEVLFLSILLEQQKEIQELKAEIQKIKKEKENLE